jgi:hypothetical protein
MRLRSLVHCLDVLDALDPMHYRVLHDSYQDSLTSAPARPSRTSER